MWYVTFIPDREGTDGMFSVLDAEDLMRPHKRAFVELMKGNRTVVASRAELIMHVTADRDEASIICQGLMKMARGEECTSTDSI